MPAAGVLAVGGLLACFAGYRLFRLVLGLYGFIIGAVLTTGFMGGGTANAWTLVLAAVVGGLLGAGLMIAAYFLGVGLIGAGLGALGLNLVWARLASTPEPPPWLLALVAVLGALAALSMVRYVVIIGTALGGSWTMLVGALALTGEPSALKAASAGNVWVLYPLDPSPSHWWLPFAWIGLALVGALVQLMTSAKKKTLRAAMVGKKKA
jgi:hypothetical protein